MRLDFIPEPDEFSIQHKLNNSKITEVSSYTAALAYNELCKVICGRWPDAVIQEEAPFAHDFFMKLFGVIPNE